MFDKLKETIKELAKTAVVKAEKALGSQKGQEKKDTFTGKFACESILFCG